jgi:hypothetical protein
MIWGDYHEVWLGKVWENYPILRHCCPGIYDDTLTNLETFRIQIGYLPVKGLELYWYTILVVRVCCDTASRLVGKDAGGVAHSGMCLLHKEVDDVLLVVGVLFQSNVEYAMMNILC